MNRRRFLSSLAAAAAAFTLDPGELLWKPTKTIFIPPAPKTALRDDISGLSVRFLRSYDISESRTISRIDAMWGIAAIDPVAWGDEA